MIVTVLRDAGNPDAPQGATVDASGWGNLDLMLQMGYARPATAAELAAYQATLSAPASEPEPTPPPEPDPEPEAEPEPPPELEPVASAKPTVRRSRA